MRLHLVKPEWDESNKNVSRFRFVCVFLSLCVFVSYLAQQKQITINFNVTLLCTAPLWRSFLLQSVCRELRFFVCSSTKKVATKRDIPVPENGTECPVDSCY